MDFSHLSTTNRNVESVPKPFTEILQESQLFKRNGGLPKLNILREHFIGEGRISENAAVRILKAATNIFREEPNLLTIPAPITICGDVHGQFYDLVHLFSVAGDPENNRFLFLGDYVDRGYFSIEVVLYMYALKITYPKNFFMLRGNHESRHLTTHFTFRAECLLKYTKFVYDKCMASFDALPLAALMNQQFFCVHGGISPHIQTLQDITTIDRFCEPPTSGPMCDLLWADPSSNFGEERGDGEHFLLNSVRGCSYYYTHPAVCKFLEKNKLLCVIRAHEAQDAGYRMYKKMPSTNFPTVITVFSAPNYCDSYHNRAAVIKYGNDIINVKTFDASPHPFMLPNFENGFTWSIPFLAEKVTNILVCVLDVCTDEEMEDQVDQIIATKREVIRSKILAVGKIHRYFSVLRQNNEEIILLKGMTPHKKLPLYTLSGGSEEINNLLLKFEQNKKLSFQEAKKLDSENEKMPNWDSDE